MRRSDLMETSLYAGDATLAAENVVEISVSSCACVLYVSVWLRYAACMFISVCVCACLFVCFQNRLQRVTHAVFLPCTNLLIAGLRSHN